MSLTRRMTAVGLPAAGVTLFAAFAMSASPAAATTGEATAVRPMVMSTQCDRGYDDICGATTPSSTHTRGGHGGYGTPASTTPATTRPGTPAATTPSTPKPSQTTPTGGTDTVPPGGVSPSSHTPTPGSHTTTPGGGVSAGSELPVTGAPMGLVISVGTLMVAAGAASVWYTRRRRSI